MRIADKVSMIEYWVNNPDTTMRTLAAMYVISEHTAGRIISNYLGKDIERPVMISRQSKLNEPELIVI
jgi:predicted HTH transcriptional regulator